MIWVEGKNLFSDIYLKFDDLRHTRQRESRFSDPRELKEMLRILWSGKTMVATAAYFETTPDVIYYHAMKNGFPHRKKSRRLAIRN